MNTRMTSRLALAEAELREGHFAFDKGRPHDNIASRSSQPADHDHKRKSCEWKSIRRKSNDGDKAKLEHGPNRPQGEADPTARRPFLQGI